MLILKIMEMVEDWSDIPTPHFESVLTYQEFSDDVIKWMYILGGRLCFELNELDKWQIIPFFKRDCTFR